MDKNEILKQLEMKMSHFSIYNVHLFQKLMTLSKEDVVIENSKAIIVTPLLSKIYDYNLIDIEIDDFEREFFHNEIKDKKSTKIITQALELASVASQYFQSLVDEEILHPVVLMGVYKEELQYTQDEFYEAVYELTANTFFYDEKQQILDLLSLVDKNSLEEYEEKFQTQFYPQLKPSLSAMNIESVLDTLISYTDKKLYLESGVSPIISFLISEILKVLNNVKEKTCCSNEIQFIEMAENRAQKVKSVFYLYQQELNKYQSYKSKCKKM